MLRSIVILIVLSLFLGTAAWLVFLWAARKGEFDDIEGPKHRMLFGDDEPRGPDRSGDRPEHPSKGSP